MRKISRVAMQRVALYLGISVFGMGLLIGAYCLISGRSPVEVLENLWVALLFAFFVAVATALRDQRKDEAPRSKGTNRK
ncbi:hypothetical protein ACT3UD_14570 [Glutamicibacter sp. 287]|uniref:dicarboxylate/amino acid:cation symporter n=1 Tax=Micrococcaceae TaxID=1268 RepID=UPI0011412E05|nr:MULTISPECIES: dicarboxylate/amino acid:cation symporter [Micrococcaceae]